MISNAVLNTKIITNVKETIVIATSVLLNSGTLKQYNIK